jgi:acetyltransferase
MEFSLLVADPWQKQGLGFEILSLLIAIGKAEGLKRITGAILPENAAMKSICAKLGFKTQYSNETKSLTAVLEL